MAQDLLHAIFQDNAVGNKDTELESLRHRCEALEVAVLSLALGVYDVQDYISLYAKYPKLRRKLKKCGQNMHVPLTKYHAVQFKKGGPPIQIDTQYLVESAISLEKSRVLDLFKQGYHTVAGVIHMEYEALVRRSIYYKFLEQATKILLMFLGIVISIFGLFVHIVRSPKKAIRFILRIDISFTEKVRRVVQTWFPMLLNPERYLRDVHNDPNHRVLAEISNTLEGNWWNSDMGSYSEGGQFDDTMSEMASEESGVALISVDAPDSQSICGASPIVGVPQFIVSPRIEPAIIDVCPSQSTSGQSSNNPATQDESSIYGKGIVIVVAAILVIVYIML